VRRFSAELEQLEILRQFIEEQAAILGVDASLAEDVVLAANEIATNTIEHGYRGQNGVINVEVKLVDDALIVRLHDDAPSFNPTLVPPPDITVPLHLRKFGGMGIQMARQLTDEMHYHVPLAGGNEITLIKKGVRYGNSKGGQ
jgi:anti-sigma regulatory factor (Ser/Thr protein kinase)